MLSEEDKILIRNAHERNLAETQDLNNANRMLFQSIIDFATLSIKSSIMINGGAAVSLLAFFGNIWRYCGLNVAYIVCSLQLFAFGTFAACIGAGFAYLSQCGFLYEGEPYKWANLFRYLSISSVLVSYVLFLYGVIVIGGVV